MRTSYMWTGGIKKKIATVPPLSSEMPLYRGHPHGETMAEGLPKRLPKGLPSHGPVCRHSHRVRIQLDGESFGETIGETFRQGLPMTKPFATGRFRYMMGRR